MSLIGTYMVTVLVFQERENRHRVSCRAKVLFFENVLIID